ncbi:MAG: hypothetical protein JO250_00660 [Armatimonadetes bacterium]|nr:hypothetical protein [Armatimonadota bacterium]
MIYGHVRDKFARLTIPLPGLDGSAAIEFILDTGFEGHLSLPGTVVDTLDATYLGDRPVAFADGAVRTRPFYQIMLEWQDELRPVEIIALDGKPLLGVELMEGSFLQAEMRDGGEVSLEPL